MSILSAWLARRKSRRATRRLMRQLIAMAESAMVLERKVWQSMAEFCNTDFRAIWAAHAATLGKDVDSLTIEDKKQAHLNYVLRD